MSSQSRDRSLVQTVEEGDGSTKAVRGSPEPLSGNGDGDDGGNSTAVIPGSQNSMSESPRSKHLTRAAVRRVQDFQRGHDQPISSTDEILNCSDSLLRGLTPPPWPSDLIPHRKRPRRVEEILDDDSPRSRDKLSVELDEMASDSKKRKVELPYRAKQGEAGPSSRPSDRE
ncbi:hypothetical protein PFICI_04850 [Pestalotiopsis fici W106-1]|uniref:Uncharacterized protein n=1 Tax=Pestalotiopsis fici (strain W106-1 / CGMCC3.15140) TaxID=1229662 RepID=W3XAC1_PESFW|nr:uncharacterized protein PFICI_04850 [Pestalotiopsis fici W106-1]ETS82974.1 hypothetical protein PFICI_04850 [Pestalotiopsis fici W106-1]